MNLTKPIPNPNQTENWFGLVWFSTLALNVDAIRLFKSYERNWKKKNGEKKENFKR